MFLSCYVFRSPGLFSLHTSGDEEYRPNEMASLMNYAEPGHALGVFRAGNESRLMAVVRRRHRHFSAAVSTTTTPSLSTQGTASTTQASTSSVTTESSTSRSVQTDESLGTSKPTTSAAGLGVNQLLLDLRIAFQKKRLGSNRFHIVHTPTGDVLKAERDGSLRFVSYAEINPRVPNDRQSIEFHTVKLPSRRALFEETCYKAPDQHNKAVTSSMPSNNTTPSTVAQ